jgi:hypothetical protein
MANPKITVAERDQRVIRNSRQGNPRITAEELAKKLKRSKYGVRNDEQGKIDRTYKGVIYHSKREAEYAQELDCLKRAGHIEDWKRQQPYRLDVNGTHICDYVADFLVIGDAYGDRVIDVKGHMTEVARLKLKLMRAIHGVEVEIVK